MEDTTAARTIAWEETATLRRRQFLDLVRRRVRPGGGSRSEFLTTRTWNDPTVDLHGLHTPFVIVGGVATALYMPQRLTLDVDLLVVAVDAPRLHEELRRGGGTLRGPLAVGGTTWDVLGGQLDVLESGEGWVPDAIRTPNRSPTGLPVIALPFLVLMKLQASRTLDLGDLSRMLGLADEPARERVREVIRVYRPQDLPDVESLIALGELELGSP